MKWRPMRSSLLLVVLVAACQKAPPTTPDGTFRVFSDTVRKQDAKTAFTMLSDKSRALLTERSKTLSAASKGTIKEEPALLSFLSPRRASPLVSVSVAKADDAKAELDVKLCNQPLDASGACPAGADVQERVTMVKEAQRWAVELPELVTP